MYKSKNGEFDVDEFIAIEDTMKIFEDYRLNNPVVYDYIKIIIKRAYLLGGIDVCANLGKDLKD